jgi:hypothetical protein
VQSVEGVGAGRAKENSSLVPGRSLRDSSTNAHPAKSETRTHRTERLRDADEITPMRMELIELSRKTICDATTDGAAEGLARIWQRLNSHYQAR